MGARPLATSTGPLAPSLTNTLLSEPKARFNGRSCRILTSVALEDPDRELLSTSVHFTNRELYQPSLERS
jgi:hypothetical protein